jgi:hypothetical protein
MTCTGPVIEVGSPLNPPLSARIPIASEPSVLIGPEAFTVTLPLAIAALLLLLVEAAMPIPPPP